MKANQQSLRNYLNWFWLSLKAGTTFSVMFYLFFQYVVGTDWPTHGLLMLFIYIVAYSLWGTLILMPNWRSMRRRVVFGIGVVPLVALLRLVTWELTGAEEVIRTLILAAVVVLIVLPVSLLIGDRMMKRQVARINDGLDRLHKQ